MKYKKGDRVKVYGHVVPFERPYYMRGNKAKVVSVTADDEINVVLEEHDWGVSHSFEVHPKQCRKIKNKAVKRGKR